MLTFHGSQELKSLYVSRIKDAISKGNLRYGSWGTNTENGWSGCALGTLAHENGIRIIERLSERMGVSKDILAMIPGIFDHLPTKERETFSINFIESIPVGVEIDEEIIGRLIAFSNKGISEALFDRRDITNRYRLLGEFLIDTLSAIPARTRETSMEEREVVEESQLVLA